MDFRQVFKSIGKFDFYKKLPEVPALPTLKFHTVYLTLFLTYLVKTLSKMATNAHAFSLVSLGVNTLGLRYFDPPQY